VINQIKDRKAVFALSTMVQGMVFNFDVVCEQSLHLSNIYYVVYTYFFLEGELISMWTKPFQELNNSFEFKVGPQCTVISNEKSWNILFADM